MAKREEEAGSGLPVMLIHGFLSTAEMVSPMAARIAARGFDVHQPKLAPFCIQDVEKLAGELEQSIDEVLHKTGAERCHLVGISQGGIIALHYLKLRGGGDRTGRLVTVAAPFGGTWAPVIGLLGAPLLGWVSRGVWQVIPGSLLLEQLSRAPMPEGIEVTTIAVEGDLIAPPARCHLEGARHVTVAGVPLVAHQWMVLSVPVVDAVAQALGQ